MKLPALSNELYEFYPSMSAQTHEAEVKAYAKAMIAIQPKQTVKQLDWKATGLNGQSLAATAFGIDSFYLVRGTPGDWTLVSPGPTKYVETPGYESRAAATDAAQVDFDRRIRATLTEGE